jgi:hypothetical protein
MHEFAASRCILGRIMTNPCPAVRGRRWIWCRRAARVAAALAAACLVGSTAGAQTPPPAQPAVPLARFAGTWVGTQGWGIEEPPPGARRDQPVTLTIEVVDGMVTGTMEPFLGGEEGATFVDARLVGEELHATAVVGRPRQGAARRGPPNWKETVAIAFVFRNNGVEMTGTADVTMSDVPWMKFTYQLGKKRSRY